MRAAVLVPVKAFTLAKGRLADHLTSTDRARLAREMAELVLISADALPRFVVCDDDFVARWATDQGATVVWRPGVGLNGAVASAVSHLADCGVERVLVAHSDLPLSRGLDRLVDLPSDIVLVPDRRGDGTNVVVVPAALGFAFGYGSASFPRHRAQALALNQTITIVHDPRLAHDVDTIDDLVPLQELFPWLPTNPANPRLPTRPSAGISTCRRER